MSKVGAVSRDMAHCQLPFIQRLFRQLAWGLWFWVVCSGFVFAVQQDDVDPDADILQQLPHDRRAVQQLQALAAAIQAGDLAQFRTQLDALRAADASLMVPARNDGFLPLHRALTLELSAVTGEFRRQLDADDVLAKASYSAGFREAGIAGLVRLLHQHAGTPTSLRIHLLLARVHEDRGQRLAARYWLSPLQSENTPAEMKEAVRELSVRLAAPGGAGDGAGDTPPLQTLPGGTAPAKQTPTGSVDRTANPAAISTRGTSPAPPAQAEPVVVTAQSQASSRPADAASDNSAAAVGSVTASKQQAPLATDALSTNDAPSQVPRFLHWVQSIPGTTLERETFRLYVERAEQRNFIPWTAMEPRADTERIFVRLAELLVAFDRSSGRPLWTRPLNHRAPIDQEEVEELEQALQRMRASSRLTVSPDVVLRCENLSRLTTDARHVYTIVETSQPGEKRSPEAGRQFRRLLGRAETMEPSVLELIAFDKLTGRRVWTVGGTAIEARYGNELSEAWLAGPPAVSGERLYQVVEKKSVISLACLSAATGEVQWMTPMVYPELDIQQDPARELFSARTIAHEGMILTSTTTGWIVAIDNLTGTTLWARSCPMRENTQVRISRGGRRLPMMRALDIRPHEQTWRSEDPMIFSDKVLWCLAECSRLFSLDMETGRVRWVEPAKDLTLLLHSDPQLLIAASGLSLKALQLPAMKEVWKDQRRPGSPVPVGGAASFGQQLLIPLSDGSVEARDRNSGRILEVLPRVRFGRNTGGMLADATGVISFGFDHLAVFSQQPPGALNTEDFVQQAAFLLESGQLDAAEQALAKAPETTLTRPEIRHLRFRMALTRIARSDDAAVELLDVLEQTAQSARERALSQLLQVDQLARLNPATLPQELLQRLHGDVAVLSVELPDPDLIRRLCRDSCPADLQFFGYSSKGVSTRQTTLRASLLNRLRELLQSGDAGTREWLVTQAADLTDLDLCGLRSEWLVDECLRRVEQQIAAGRITEQTMHLLFTAMETVDSARPAAVEGGKVEVSGTSDRSVRFESLLRALQQAVETPVSAGADNGTSQRVSQRLLQILVAELRQELFGPAEDSQTRLSAAMAERWKTVDQGQWKMIPLSTVGIMNRQTERTLIVRPVSPDDAFLGSFNSLQRRDTMLFQLQDLLDPPRQLWGCPMLPWDLSVQDAKLTITRCGSVLLLGGRASLSALSVLDHRWLWTRRIMNNSHAMPHSDEGFTEYTAEQGRGHVHDSGRRVCGFTRRWLCLRSDSELEVLDILTGERIWSVQVRGLPEDVFACDRAIVLRDGGDGREVILDPLTGQSQNRKRASLRVGRDRSLSLPTSIRLSALTSRIIRAAGPSLVVWDSEASFDDVRTIDWVHAETLETEHSVALPGLISARFLNPDLLLAFIADEQALLVNLVTRKVQSLDFGSDEPGATPLRSDRLNAWLDAENLYVYETRPAGSRGIVIPSLLSDTQWAEINSQIRAVNRQTGKLRWVLPLSDSMLFSLEQPPGPLLLMMEISEDKTGGNGNPNLRLPIGDSRTFRLHGYSRQSGLSLLKFPVVAQFPVSGIQFEMPTPDLLDLSVLGNRVRLMKTAAAAAP